MQNILTVEEVVERIKKAGSAPRQPQVLHSPKLRPEYQPHPPEPLQAFPNPVTMHISG